MAFLLSIETSTRVCSVALHGDGELLAFSQYFLEKSHSSILTPLIQETVRNSGLEMTDLSVIAISEGPGSYTGLRIGTSTAKGLCFGLDIPLVAVNTLFAMAAAVSKYNLNDSFLCPMLDARRMEVYSMLLKSNLDIVDPVTPLIIDSTSFKEYLENEQIMFFGNGSNKCKEVIESGNAIFVDGVHPDAAAVGEIAWQKFVDKDFVDVAGFEPYYLKAFRAGKPKQLI